MQELLNALWRDDSGQDLAEYGLLVALIAIIAVAGVTVFGNDINNFFNGIAALIPLP